MASRQGPRIKYRIGEETFTSKDAVKKRCQGILYSGKPIDVAGRDHAFLLALLGRHRHAVEKIGVGVKRFYVERTEWGNDSFKLERLDGSTTDWSFLACITPPTQKAEVISALRTLVDQQCREFRDHAFNESITVLCGITGLPVTMDECHVDHVPPQTFDALVTSFLKEKCLSVEQVGVEPTRDNSVSNALTDLTLAMEWVGYHSQHARLRITSVRANLSQGTKVLTGASGIEIDEEA